jgi:NAD(P)H-dependent flavin oxidoreductase YrpB (nitropropane dioxygenase family)
MLAVSAAYLGACLDARRSDAGLARQLRVLTTSGGFPGEFREAIAASGVLHMHKVGSTRQAVRAQEAGVDVIIASGYEMGGHTHRLPVHTFVLVPNVTAEVDVPVLLGGGARDGRTLAAALVLGAAGVAMGTRFIATRDNDWHPAYRDRIVQATEGEDVVFRGVYGPARGLRNSALERLAELERVGVDETTLTRWKDAALRRAEIEGDVENGLVAAGQVASGIHDVPSVADLVVRMMSEAIAVIESVSATAVVC